MRSLHHWRLLIYQVRVEKLSDMLWVLRPVAPRTKGADALTPDNRHVALKHVCRGGCLLPFRGAATLGGSTSRGSVLPYHTTKQIVSHNHTHTACTLQKNSRHRSEPGVLCASKHAVGVVMSDTLARDSVAQMGSHRRHYRLRHCHLHYVPPMASLLTDVWHPGTCALGGCVSRGAEGQTMSDAAH